MRQILQRGKRRERDAEPYEPNVAAIGVFNESTTHHQPRSVSRRTDDISQT